MYQFSIWYIKNTGLLISMHVIESYTPLFQIQEVSRDNEQENHYEEGITSFSTCSPRKLSSMLHIYITLKLRYL